MSFYVTFYPVLRSSHFSRGPVEDKKHAVLDAPVYLRMFFSYVHF